MRSVNFILTFFQRPKIIPFRPATVRKKGHGFRYKGREFIHYSELDTDQTAFHRLSEVQIVLLFVAFGSFISALIYNWHFTMVSIFAVLTFIYFADLLFNLYLIFRSLTKPAEIQISKKEMDSIKDQDWPTYTVFCPLYKEWQVLPQFITAMSRLEYPKNKLQVMLLLEEDDKETIAHVKNYTLPKYFDTVIVPYSLPKTKPKACNYGLIKATGKYSVIYDAEDVPDTKQLKKAVLAFQKAGEKTVCIQAKLNFYNPYQNLLTRVFTAEYSLWFDLVLTGLQSIHAPIPLGGTSNHFKTADLRILKGWDSFNVTEDCDLGIRLVKQGYKTAIIDSMTLEEANSSILNWFGQRTRWIKGYMQTYLLHMRKPQEFIRNWSEPHVVTFQLIVGGKVLSMFINPLMWITTISYFAFRSYVGTFIESFFPTPILYMAMTSLLFGNFLYVYYYMIGCAKHGHHELTKYGILVPFYWLAMSIAAFGALYKLITAPHHWSKTKHGLHLGKKIVLDIDISITKPSFKRNKISGISVVLPAFNEEENILPMIEKVDTFMKTRKIDYEIIIVNDGSRDKTKRLIDNSAKRSKRIKTIHHKTNLGYGAALRSGFNAAKKKWIFFTDSDMQFDITEMTKLMEKVQDAQFVVGYRQNRQDPLMRIINANIYKMILKLLFQLDILDIDCAFKLFPREVITTIPLHASGALINAELLVKAKRKNYTIMQVPVSHYPRTRGQATGANLSVIFRAMRELIIFRTSTV